MKASNKNSRKEAGSGPRIDLEHLSTLSHALLHSPSFEEAAAVVFNCCKQLTGAQGGYVALLSADGVWNDVLFLDAGGRICTVNPELPMPVRGLRAEACELGKPVYENDFHGSGWMHYLPEGHVRLDNVLFGPLLVDGHPAGLLGLANKQGGFNSQDSAAVEAFGKLASLALQNSRLADRLREQPELRLAERMEAVGTFAAGLAHDFNNLLGTILGNLTLAGEQPDRSAESADFLREAESAVLRTRDLVRKFMVLTADRPSDNQPLALQDFLQTAAELVLSGSGISCDVTFPDEIPLTVQGDRQELMHALQHLIANAREAMDDTGALHVIADSWQNPDNGNHNPKLARGSYGRIQIIDRGRGIAAQHLPKIFDPYFSTKPRGIQKGMGMGLSAARAIIKRHGGTLEIASTEQRGTTVTVYLPLHEHTAPSGQADAASIAQKPLHILFMDDEDSLRISTARLLQRLGHRVTAVENGESAIRHFRQARQGGTPFDLAILDLTVKGGMGGLETLERLRAIDPQVPAIVASGYFDDPVLGNFKQHGFQAAVPKPFTLEELGAVITHLQSQWP